jgi:hypothetical protein
MVKAAPADEARVVRPAKRREALALEMLKRVLCAARKPVAIGGALERSIEADRCQKLGHSDVPLPRERIGYGRTFTSYAMMRGLPSVHEGGQTARFASSV